MLRNAQAWRIAQGLVAGLALFAGAAYAQPTLVLSLSDGATVAEGESVAVTIGLQNPPSQGAYRDCRLEAVGGTASHNDYNVAASGRIEAPNWQLDSALTVLADGVEEGTETLTLAGKCGGTQGDTMPRHLDLLAQSVTVQLVDSNVAPPPAPEIRVSGPSLLTEGDGTVLVTMYLGNPPQRGGYRDCRLETSAGLHTARPREDYRLPTATGRLHSDEAWQALFALTVVADDVVEPAETFAIEGKCGGTVGDTTPHHSALVSVPLALSIVDRGGGTPPPPEPPPPPPPPSAPTIELSLPGIGPNEGRCGSGEQLCLAEDVDEVAVTFSIANPPAQGGYRGCRLVSASASATPAATLGEDYRLPGDGALVSAQTGWSAVLPLLVEHDSVAEETEILTLRGVCRETIAGTEPGHAELLANEVTVRIADVPRPRLIAPIEDVALRAGDELTVRLDAVFEREDGLRYAVESSARDVAPATLRDGRLRVIVRDNAQAGMATVTVRAINAAGVGTSDSFDLRVAAGELAPTALDGADISARTTVALAGLLSPFSAAPAYTATADPRDLANVDVGDGALTIVPREAESGRLTLVITADNGSGVAVARRFQLAVTAAVGQRLLRGWRLAVPVANE